MKLSTFCPFGLKTPIHAPKIGVFGVISPPKWGAISTKPPKGTSSGRAPRGVLIMSVSSIVPEKSRGNKKRHEEEELRHIFGRFGITVKWP